MSYEPHEHNTKRLAGPPRAPAAAHPPTAPQLCLPKDPFPHISSNICTTQPVFSQSVDVLVFFLHFPPDSQDIEYPFIHLSAFQVLPSSSVRRFLRAPVFSC